MLGVRTAFVGPVISAALQCSCTPLTIVCCHHRRPKDANIFRVLTIASGRGSTIMFNVNLFVNFFEKEFNENKVDLSPVLNQNLSKNVYLENIRFIVQ